VRSFLNEIICINDKSSGSNRPIGKANFMKYGLTIDARNLLLYHFPVDKQENEFECGYYVIMYIAIMYRKVVFQDYKGVGPITSKSVTGDILLETNVKDKCLLIMKDLNLLFSLINNISAQINIKKRIDCIDEDSIDSSDEDIKVGSNNFDMLSHGNKTQNTNLKKKFRC
jgi:hypothetical protein